MEQLLKPCTCPGASVKAGALPGCRSRPDPQTSGFPAFLSDVIHSDKHPLGLYLTKHKHIPECSKDNVSLPTLNFPQDVTTLSTYLCITPAHVALRRVCRLRASFGCLQEACFDLDARPKSAFKQLSPHQRFLTHALCHMCHGLLV